ncbi:MAG: hypothetical protein GQ578_05775 [Desulfuromonadaceae bacterium]|nr:hypothetical protein [Desulfuromonadaceae bacterium]
MSCSVVVYRSREGLLVTNKRFVFTVGCAVEESNQLLFVVDNFDLVGSQVAVE